MAITVFFFQFQTQKLKNIPNSLNLESCWTWWVPSAGTGCYLNQERGTWNGCIAVIHIRIQFKNPFHKVLTNRPCYLLQRPSWKSACSKLVLRPFSSSRHPLFWILMGITGVNPFLVPRFSFPVSRSPFPVPRSPFFVLRSSFSVLRSSFSVLRSPILILVQNLPCLNCVFSSVLNSRSSLQNLCFYLRSVLRVLHEYKIQINAQCKAFKAPLNIFISA